MSTLTNVIFYAGTLAAVVGMVSAWRFVLAYRHDDWRRYEAGRHLMHFTAGLAVILTYVVGYQVFAVLVLHGPPVPLFAGVSRLVIFGWVAWQLTARERMLRRYERYGEPTR